MEEIEILPRDGYLHTVHITHVPCSIQWWFSTKRKNIDFGLFRRTAPPTAGSEDAPAGSAGSVASRTSTMNALTGKRLGLVPGGGSQNALDNDSRASTPQQQQRSMHFKLQDKGIVELMALKHYESSKATIKGSWTAVDPGAYILYFDNSFSKNTSKRLSFCVAVRETKNEAAIASSKARTLISGWLLKKKRKRMQGWANRWFTIQGHWLLYSTAEGGIPRAKVDLLNAVVSMSKEDCFITIDGDEGFFQLHTQKQQEFEAWVAAIKKTKENAVAATVNTNYTDGATFATGTLPHSPVAPGMAPPWPTHGSSISTEEAALAHARFMDSTDKLNALISNLQLASGSDAIQAALGYIQAIKDSEDAIYRLVGVSDKPGHPSMTRWETAASDSPSIALSASRASWFSGSGSDVFYDTNDVLEVARDEGEYSLMRASTDAHRAAAAANVTRSSSSSIRSTPSIDTSQAGRSVGPSMQAGDAYSTSDSDAAADGFFDDAQEMGDGRQSARMRQELIRDPDFMAALARNNIQHLHAAGVEAKPDGRSGAKHKDLDNNPLATLESMRPMFEGYEPRTSLPAESCEVNVSLISILRKNVGKDLTSIAMPLVMNEPINALQGLCEELMYNRLLQKADEMSDSLDRLMHVAAFAISTLSPKKYRSERKPFNPLLGETYEMVDPRSGYRFVSEKVSHHPPVMACFADSPSYRFWQDSSGKSKFWGKSMEFIQTSNVHIELLKHGDHFTYCKPSVLVRGLITGNRTVDFTGEMTITNRSTGDRCVVTFKEAGMFSSSNDMVECYLYRGSGNSKVERVLRGSWSSHLRFEKSTTQAETLWTAVSLPPESESYYRFSYYTMLLNELIPGTVQDLPLTDTRLRPDQRAYEEGRIGDAEETKHELEEAQRERKRVRDAAGADWVPQWFEERDDPHSDSGRSWQYKGGYWDARANRDFPQTVELWKTS
ncbi:Oxysterol-binding protein 3 [Coemansia sp. RSA 1933]|nr:Oxysterol-binding protein 3 [Coemansia sp. RSA 1933]